MIKTKNKSLLDWVFSPLFIFIRSSMNGYDVTLWTLIEIKPYSVMISMGSISEYSLTRKNNINKKIAHIGYINYWNRIIHFQIKLYNSVQWYSWSSPICLIFHKASRNYNQTHKKKNKKWWRMRDSNSRGEHTSR